MSQGLDLHKLEDFRAFSSGPSLGIPRNWEAAYNTLRKSSPAADHDFLAQHLCALIDATKSGGIVGRPEDGPFFLKGCREGILGVSCSFQNGVERGVIWIHACPILAGRRSQGARKSTTPSQLRSQRNSVVLRDVAYRRELARRFRKGGVHPFLPVFPTIGDYPAGRTTGPGPIQLYFTVTERSGRTLDSVFEEDYAQAWRSTGVLTESARWLVQDVFGLIDNVHRKGYRFVVVDFNEIWVQTYPNGESRMCVGNTGRGLVFDVDRSECDKGGRQGVAVRAAARQITEAYQHSPDSEVPASVDRQHLKQLRTALQVEGTHNARNSKRPARNDLQERLGDNAGGVCAEPAALAPAAVGMPADFFDSIWASLNRFQAGTVAGHGDTLFGDIEGNGQPKKQHAQAQDCHLRTRDWQQALFNILHWLAGGGLDMQGQAWKGKAQQAVLAGKGPTTDLLRPLGLSTAVPQPLAMSRWGEMFCRFLNKDTVVFDNLSLDVAVSTPVHTPEQEAKIQGEGLRMPVNRLVLGKDEEWVVKAEKALQGYDDHDPGPVDLVIEHGKGVGVRVVGTWQNGVRGRGQGSKKRFGGWYCGPAVKGPLMRATGRFVVSRAKDGTVRCNAEPCRRCPLEWYIENGIPGPFVNSDETGGANLALDRNCWFEHDGLVWIPMYVVRDFTGFASWSYPLALEGLRA
jgi:hypothetical protein